MSSQAPAGRTNTGPSFPAALVATNVVSFMLAADAERQRLGLAGELHLDRDRRGREARTRPGTGRNTGGTAGWSGRTSGETRAPTREGRIPAGSYPGVTSQPAAAPAHVRPCPAAIVRDGQRSTTPLGVVGLERHDLLRMQLGLKVDDVAAGLSVNTRSSPSMFAKADAPSGLTFPSRKTPCLPDADESASCASRSVHLTRSQGASSPYALPSPTRSLSQLSARRLPRVRSRAVTADSSAGAVDRRDHLPVHARGAGRRGRLDRDARTLALDRDPRELRRLRSLRIVRSRYANAFLGSSLRIDSGSARTVVSPATRP